MGRTGHRTGMGNDKPHVQFEHVPLTREHTSWGAIQTTRPSVPWNVILASSILYFIENQIFIMNIFS